MPLSRLSESTCRKELQHNLLPFWREKMTDIRHGGLYSRMASGGAVESGEKYGAMHAAVLYIFSAAYLRLGISTHRSFATSLYEYMVGRYWDEDYGGVNWSLDARGAPKHREKNLTSQALTLLAFCAYFKASEDRQAFSLAKDIYLLIEEHFFDPTSGSYIEAFDQDWEYAQPATICIKNLKAELLLISAYTSLYKIWPDEDLHKRALWLSRKIIRDRLQRTKYSQVYVNGFGHLSTDSTLLGHEAESCWLLHDAATTLRSPELAAVSEKLSLSIAQRLVEAQQPDGGILDQTDYGVAAAKYSWTQAQGLVALVNTWIITGDDYYRHRAEKVWEFIQKHVRDESLGGWRPTTSGSFHNVSAHDKVSIENFGYHGARAMLELMDRFTIAQSQSR